MKSRRFTETVPPEVLSDASASKFPSLEIGSPKGPLCSVDAGWKTISASSGADIETSGLINARRYTYILFLH
jgi:hypothetical protein